MRSPGALFICLVEAEGLHPESTATPVRRCGEPADSSKIRPYYASGRIAEWLVTSCACAGACGRPVSLERSAGSEQAAIRVRPDSNTRPLASR